MASKERKKEHNWQGDDPIERTNDPTNASSSSFNYQKGVGKKKKKRKKEVEMKKENDRLTFPNGESRLG